MSIRADTAIKKRMQKLGTYKPEFDAAIMILVQLQEQYDAITQIFKSSGYAFEVETETGSKKAPIVTTLESLRKDILSYMNALGLTPSGLKNLTGGAPAPEKPKEPADPFAAALARVSGDSS